MSPQGLTLDVARAVARERAAALGYRLVEPDDPRRELVVQGVALVSSWPVAHVRRYLSVTLPGDGGALDGLALIPTVGPVLLCAARAWGDGRPQVFYSPAAWEDPVELPTTEAHEEVHVLDLDGASTYPLGVARWCVGYLGAPELRAASEGQGYTQSMAGHVVLRGMSPEAAAASARESLLGYSLEEPDRMLADAMVEVCRRTLEAKAPVPGPVLEVFRSLQRKGVAIPGWALP